MEVIGLSVLAAIFIAYIVNKIDENI